MNVGRAPLTGCVDGIYLAPREMFEALGYRVPPVPPEIRNDPTRSSGVYQAASERLRALHYRIYQVKRSLCRHVGNESKMHPELRRSQPIRTVHFIDSSE
jgi:hypothetical protein